jgi:hypothetical protein
MLSKSSFTCSITKNKKNENRKIIIANYGGIMTHTIKANDVFELICKTLALSIMAEFIRDLTADAL